MKPYQLFGQWDGYYWHREPFGTYDVIYRVWYSLTNPNQRNFEYFRTDYHAF